MLLTPEQSLDKLSPLQLTVVLYATRYIPLSTSIFLLNFTIILVSLSCSIIIKSFSFQYLRQPRWPFIHNPYYLLHLQTIRFDCVRGCCIEPGTLTKFAVTVELDLYQATSYLKAVLGIRMFLGLQDPDPDTLVG